MPQILLIRPGCTEFDEQQRIQGTLDLPLSPRGEQQVAGLLDELRKRDIDLVLASPCEPSRSTAAMIGSALGVDVKEIDNLQNVNQGLWQGLQLDAVRKKHPRVFRQWEESPESVCPPGGETLSEAVRRVRQALEKPLRKKGTIAIVAADPLAAIIVSVLRGAPLEAGAPACSGACGTVVVVKENTYKSVTGEFVSPEAAAARPI
jgi:probable phosphoglycerate mutase